MTSLRRIFVAGFFLFFVAFVVGGALLAAAQLENLGGWPYWRVLPLALGLAVAGAAATAVLGLLLPQRWRDGFVLGLQALTIVALVTTTFMPQGVQRLDGAAGVPPSYGSLALIWGGYLAVAGVLAWLLRRKGMLQRLFHAAAVISVVAVVAVAVLFSTSKAAELEQLRASGAPLEELYEFGSRRNVVVVLMDMLQGSFVEQTLASDPVVKARYGDFTAYTRAISTFPFTTYSLPTILSGVPYASPQDKRYTTNVPAAIADSFMTDAARRGYEVTGVQSVLFLPVAARNIPAFEVPREAEAAPLSYGDYVLKRYAVEIAYGSLMRFLKVDFRGALGWADELTEAKASGRRLLERWAANARLGRAENKVFFVHNFVTHAPIVYDRSGGRLVDAGKYPWTHQNLLGEIAFSLELLGGVFDRMKALGVYDDALIVVVGDHGHFMGYHNPEVYAGVEDFAGYKTGRNFRPAAMYNPALLLKPPRAKAGGISHDAVGLVDVRAIIAAYLETGNVDPTQVIAARRAAQPLPVVTCIEERNAYFSDACHRLVPAPGNASTVPAVFERLQ